MRWNFIKRTRQSSLYGNTPTSAETGNLKLTWTM